MTRKDTFSLDRTLAPVIHAGLVKFSEVLKEKESTGGFFGVPYEFYDEETETINPRDWFDTIDKMIYAFADYKYDFDLEYNKEHQEKISEGLVLFGKYYTSLWW